MTDFEDLDSVEDMLDYIAENGESPKEEETDLAIELQLLQVQGFLKMFAKCQTFTDEQKEELEQCVIGFNDPNINVLGRHAALARACEIFFPELENKKEIGRKNESRVYQTPCEDCNASPTHLIVFKQDNRTEEHFLCEDCERSAIEEELT